MIKKLIYLPFLLLGFMFSNTMLSSCKNKKQTDTTDTTPAAMDTTPVTQTPAPVVIEADDPLATMVTDATKDYPTVKPTVKDGIITLNGEIKRSDLKKLMTALNELHPKKIENQLVIK